MKITRYLHLFALPALLAVSAVSAFCQADTGTLLGTVADPTQAFVPNATVTLRNTATGTTTSTVTNREGVFQFPGVLVGGYSLKVTALGFKTYEMTGMALLSLKTAT